MSNSIDQRIVEMQFDNAKFNENVKSTINAMEELDRSMTFGSKGSSALSKLSKSLKDAGSGKVSLGLQRVRNALSSIGSVAHNAFSAIADRASSAARALSLTLGGAMAAVGGLVVSGGTKRALNLEHANFQLKGLLKDGKRVEAVMKDVNASVLGTAYGLDEAAVVASQFAASEIKASQEHGLMLEALRGVAGVAAMGGAEYSRVGQIFTTVAGQGRLMGDQLLQLSTMGLNAASTLKDYLNEIENTTSHTEEEIREMVSDGKIDFETFAKAMDWAFGEHATKANETFTGALSNVKAALSRVGAEFAMPTLENLRKNFLAVIPVIDTFKNAMTPIVGLYKNITGRATQKVIDFLKPWESFDDEGNRVLPFVDTLSKRFEVLAKYLKAIDLQGERVLETLFNQFADGFNILKDHAIKDIFEIDSDQYAIFAKDLKGIANILRDVIKYVGTAQNTVIDSLLTVLEGAFPGVQHIIDTFAPILTQVGDAFVAAFPPSLFGGFKDWGAGFTEFITSLEPLSSPELADAIIRFATGFFDAVHGLFTIGSGALSGLVEAVKGLIECLVLLAPDILNSASAGLEKLTSILTSLGVGDRLSSLGASIGSFFRNFGKSVKSFTDNGAGPLEGVVSTIEQFFAKLSGFVKEKGLIDGIGEMINSLLEALSIKVSNIGEALKGGDILKKIADFGRNIPYHMTEFFKGLGDSIRTFLQEAGLGAEDALGLINTLVLTLSGLLTTNVLRDVGQKWYTFVSNMARGILNVAAFDLDDRWKQMKVVIRNFMITLSATFTISNMLKIAAAIAILVGAMWLLSTMDSDQLASGLVGVTLIMGILIGAMNLLAVASKDLGFMQITGLTSTLVGFAAAILILAAAARILGSADLPTLAKGLGAIGLAMLIMTSALQVMSNFERGVFASAASIGAIASAMLVLAAAIAIFGHMDIQTLVVGLSALGATLMVLTVALTFLGETKAQVTAAAAALMVVAQAMLIMSIVLKILGSMSFDQLAVGIVGFGASILILAAALHALDDPKILIGANAMLVAAAAMLVLAPAILMLSSMSFESVAVALFAIAGAIAIFAVAAIAIGPAIESMTLLAAALTSLSLSVMLAGAGVALLAVGLMTLASVGSAGLLVLVNAVQILVTAILTMLPEIAAAVLNVFLTIIEAFLERVPALCEISLTAFSAMISGLATLVPQFMALGVLLLLAFLQAVQIVIPEAVHTAVILISALCSGLLIALPTLITTAFAAILLTITAIAAVIRSSHQELYSAGKELFLAILEAMGDMFSMLLSDLSTFIQDIPAYISGEKQLFASAGTDIGTATKDSAEDSLSELPNVGSGAIDETLSSMKESINSGTEGMFDGLSDSFTSSFDALDLSGIGDGKMQEMLTSFTKVGEFESIGEQNTSGFTTGAETGMKQFPAMMGTKTSEGVNAVSAKKSDGEGAGKSVGSSMGSGMLSGLGAWANQVANKAGSIIQTAKSRANAEMNAASPAKDLIQSGLWFGQGFEIGITRMIDPVGKAAARMVDEAKKPFNFDSLVSASELIPWDETPTIRPVLDLTEYEAGLQRMQNLNSYAPVTSAALAERVNGRFGSSYTSNARHMVINLHYGAGTSPADMVNEMATILQTKNLMEA